MFWKMTVVYDHTVSRNLQIARPNKILNLVSRFQLIMSPFTITADHPHQCCHYNNGEFSVFQTCSWSKKSILSRFSK